MLDFFVFFCLSIALLLGLRIVSLSSCTCVRDAEPSEVTLKSRARVQAKGH